MKFGGTSVASHDAVMSLVGIVKRLREKRPVLVVSAVSGVTEALLALPRATEKELGKQIAAIRKTHLKLVQELFKDKRARAEVMDYVDEQLKKVRTLSRKENVFPKDKDELVSYGEVMSSFMISRVLRSHKIAAEQIVATHMIVTDDAFTQAEFLPNETRKKTRDILCPLIEQKVVPVITGFIGATEDGRVTTLGRGGSDYSASIIGHCLDSDEVQIWTDVDGVFTADPRVVKNAVLIPEISYKEASEMASFGAKVLHPRTIKPAIEKKIPIRVVNTFNTECPGTLISSHHTGVGLKAIAFKRNVILINIYSNAMLFSRGFLARVFGIFAQQHISIDLVSVSEVSISVTLDNSGQLDSAIEQLKEFSTVSVYRDGFGVVSLIGEKILSRPGLMSDVFSLFQKNRVHLQMISMGASDINVSLVIPSPDIVLAVTLIHNHFLGADNAPENATRLKE